MKVTVHAGLTFQVGPMSSNQYGRVDVTFTDLDPDKPLAPQLVEGKRTAKGAYVAVLEELDREVELLYGKGS
ncbi:hypothetical protein LCGC14_1146640 [marine sediment metagenome]|uniref:Uncharacterized protein n=1 Tax=marine sediment metagenome TaxID=412755 RepID=A0A0F9M1J3_9ZZZZ